MMEERKGSERAAVVRCSEEHEGQREERESEKVEVQNDSWESRAAAAETRAAEESLEPGAQEHWILRLQRLQHTSILGRS